MIIPLWLGNFMVDGNPKCQRGIRPSLTFRVTNSLLSTYVHPCNFLASEWVFAARDSLAGASSLYFAQNLALSENSDAVFRSNRTHQYLRFQAVPPAKKAPTVSVEQLWARNDSEVGPQLRQVCE